MLSIILNNKQQKELKGLAYHHADLTHFRERYGINDADYICFCRNVEQHFEKLDRLNVPFWVQNAVLAFSENWRQYLTMDLWAWMHKRGYNITFEK